MCSLKQVQPWKPSQRGVDVTAATTATTAGPIGTHDNHPHAVRQGTFNIPLSTRPSTTFHDCISSNEMISTLTCAPLLSLQGIVPWIPEAGAGRC